MDMHMDVGDHDCVHILPVCACTCMRLYVRHMHIRYEVCLTSYHIGTGLCTPVSVPLPIRYTPVSAPVSTLTSTPATVPASTPACTAAYTLASKYMSGGWAWTCEVCLSAMGMSPILLGNHNWTGWQGPDKAPLCWLERRVCTCLLPVPVRNLLFFPCAWTRGPAVGTH